RGEILELKTTINTMVDQLSAFAGEVTRVAREVGTEGRLGGQADVKGVSGTWKDLTESVNVMAGNLTGQVRSIAEVTTAVAGGDLSQKITVDARGEILELKDTINTMVDQLSAFADEVTRVAREVGTEGILGGQARVRGVSGTWKDLTDNVNSMGNNLTSQVRNIAQVATAVASGDLSQKITVDARGEVLELKNTLNTMVDTLRSFADEVTRVAREVGTEGILGGQAHVPGVAGTWKDLTDNVNSMADNLTGQVRSIAEVTTSVAKGDLSQKITVDARGEILELKTTINTMVDQLSAFAGEVTRVAREVGTDGILGGQAEVEGVSGTWKQLTENVNELAGNLTRQVRAIAEVATAVTRGDLTLQIDVDARGEILELRDNINQMIANLGETTQANREQDWLKTNLARISGLMQGRRDLMAVAALIMSELTPVVSAQHGAFFLAELTQEDHVELRLIASYGYQNGGAPTRFRLGQSLVGQAALEKRSILVEQAPPGYIKISSGLGEASPVNVVVLPVLFEDQLLGVLELASFSPFTQVHRNFLEQLNEQIGVTVNTIMANSRTEMLLAESQRLTEELQERSEELQRQQGELRHSNAELEDKAELLARQNRDIEIKNSEIEQARQALEERAEQLALSSRYKSEFLANMSHELRTPLNSLLILAKLLADNVEGNLTRKQVEFAETIHAAGSDLLQLINDILDLSKVQAGKMDVRPARIALVQLMDYVEATIRPLTAEKGLDFTVHVSPEVPATLYTDEQRLQQVLRNLLSNAVKFTDNGSVEVVIRLTEDIPVGGTDLDGAEHAIAFSVVDTGIGIAEDKLKVIFEAFQQADGTTSRRYGGTGLGLSISREIAWLLGGEIHAESEPGRGSTFTLYVPLDNVLADDDHTSVGAAFGRLVPELPAPSERVSRPLDGVRPSPNGGVVLGGVLPPAAAPVEAAGAVPEPGEPGRMVVHTPHVSRARVLAVEEPQQEGGPIVTTLAGLAEAVDVATAATPAEATAAIELFSPACVVVDLRLADDGGWRILESLADRGDLAGLPVVVHVPGSPTRSEAARLRAFRRRIATLQRVSSPDALAAAVADAVRPVPAEARPKPAVHPFEGSFHGEKVLIVDDDVRNVFALTSVLEQYGLVVTYAENGREGIEKLEAEDDIAIVLMDIMMPEMDGYATTAAIRRMPQYAGLPIIALTAKAMKGDQEKSIASGASDYVAKPVDTAHLLGLIRTWLEH
ncbi:hybrid sensor histidine kinase/response regulator, partial [Yinghuangia seranimata]|uniref:hybrid sensor histidine kinase/response regulator n=1 Tax=Yinghuangia seranimata TaxID=408067 RepID=UPI00248C8A6E